MIITDKDSIRKALNCPSTMPDSFLPSELIPIGYLKFKGLKVDENSNLKSFDIGYNSSFTIRKVYSLYKEEGNEFVIDDSGKGRKYISLAFTKKRG